MARRYIDIQSQGTGRARQFTFEQILQIAIMGELIAGFTIHASSAASWSQRVKLPIAETGDLLLVLDTGAAVVAHRERGQDIESLIAANAAELHLAESLYPTVPPIPLRCIVLDVSETAARVRNALVHPDLAWSDKGPSIPDMWNPPPRSRKGK